MIFFFIKYSNKDSIVLSWPCVRMAFPLGRSGWAKKNPAVETAGCKPKPTAYENYLLVPTIYLIVIAFAASLTSAFLGRFSFNTPLT